MDNLTELKEIRDLIELLNPAELLCKDSSYNANIGNSLRKIILKSQNTDNFVNLMRF